MSDVDCLIIGHNEMDIYQYEEMIRKMGSYSGGYRDLSLSIVEIDNQLFTPMDLLNYYRIQAKRDYNTNTILNYSELSPAIAYLCTYLKRKGLTYDYVNNFQNQKEILAQKLIKDKLLTIAITTTLYVIPFPILEIINFIRTYNTKVKIIVGGPYIYTQFMINNKEALNLLYKNINADYYIVNSQGENSLVNLILSLKNNDDYKQLPNIIYKNNNGNYISNTHIPENNKLEANMVDWRIFPQEDLGDYVSLRTSISCPFSCAFCGFPQRAGKYRYISPEILENNLNLLESMNCVNVIHFIDDTLNVPKNRFKEILLMMIKNKYSFKWNSMFRCQYADKEIIELMKESGCQGVFLGLESGSDSLLKNMNKKTDKYSYEKGIELLNRYELISYASFIIGFPGETEETVKETIDFIEELSPTFFRTQLWYYDHITPIWKEREQYKIRGSSFQWSHKTMNSEYACDLIDHIFLSIKNSTWLTQYKFEVPSLYYLLNKGMKLNEIKKFLTYFNKLVGNKLKGNKDRRETNQIINTITKLARFGMVDNYNQNKNNNNKILFNFDFN